MRNGTGSPRIAGKITGAWLEDHAEDKSEEGGMEQGVIHRASRNRAGKDGGEAADDQPEISRQPADPDVAGQPAFAHRYPGDIIAVEPSRQQLHPGAEAAHRQVRE